MTDFNILGQFGGKNTPVLQPNSPNILGGFGIILTLDVSSKFELQRFMTCFTSTSATLDWF